MSITSREGKKGTAYRVRIRVRDPISGKWSTVNGGTFTNAKAARREERKLQRDADVGRLADPGTRTLERYLREEWLPATSKLCKRGRPLAPTTLRRYMDSVDYISKNIGAVKLADLRPGHVEHLRDELLASGTLAPQTVGDHLRVLSQALRKAEARGLVGRNVASPELVDRPVGESRDFTIITPELAAAILEAVCGVDPWDVAAHLALGAGLRREEVLGLLWGSVDLEGARLSVNRTVTWAAGGAHIGPPKSEAGERDLALPAIVVNAIRRHRKAQRERLLAIGGRERLSDPELPVVDDGIGGTWVPATFSTYWRRFATGAGFEDVTFHTLRHGAATLLLAAGVPDPVAVSIMGHADTRILRRYQEVVPQLRRDAAARMNAILGGNS